MSLSDIFRANDIRGQYNKDFDLSFTKDLAYALCKLSKQKGIVSPRFLIGQDARLSSPEISQALVKHLKDEGAEITFIGLAPSPLCYFLLYHYNLTACIVVTASHNPSEYNGFKILFHKKHEILEPIKKLRQIVLNKRAQSKKVFQKKGLIFDVKKEEPYISSLKKEFSLKSSPFVIDTGNGALGPLAKKVFSALKLKAEYLFCEPDGRFPNHHPDPTVEKNLFSLKRKMQKEKFDFGFGFDGDGDRLVLVNKKRQSVLGDEFGSLFLKSIVTASQKQKRKPLILADVKCSDWFFEKAEKQGAKALMTQSGHGLIRSQLEKTKALLAVEFSGHIFFNDRKERGFDDALYASLRFLEILDSQKKDVSSILPKRDCVKTAEIRLDKPRQEILKTLSKIQKHLKEKAEAFNALDGIRISRNKSFALFRESKTQSALTMRFEAPTKQKLTQLKAEFSEVIGFKIP